MSKHVTASLIILAMPSSMESNNPEHFVVTLPICELATLSQPEDELFMLI